MAPHPVVNARAVLYSGLGGEDVVSVGTRHVRAPGAGEVRIRVIAAAVNPTDILLRDPGFGELPLPITPGMDAAGFVDAVGQGVDRLAVGDTVMAAVLPMRAEGGAQAAFITVPAASVVPVPSGVTSTQATTVPMNGLTALYALQIADLSPGQTLGVTGGAGWLASLAIVLAKRRGLHVVADASAAEIALVRRSGADVVVDRAARFADAARRELPAGVDALLDTALLGEQSFGAIADGGAYIPVRGWRGGPAERGIRIAPVIVSDMIERTEWLAELAALVGSGTIVPRIAGEYPPERAAEAQRRLAAGGVRGRLVIVF